MPFQSTSFRAAVRGLLVVFCLLLLVGACAELPSMNPVDLSQQPEGYFKNGIYYNEFYGATWKAPNNWKPVAPNLIQLFYFGWDGPLEGQVARLTVYRQGQEIPVKASLEQAAEIAVKQKDWVLAETPHFIESQGHRGLEALCTWKSFTGSRGRLLARFFMVKGALIVVHGQAPNFIWDRAKPGLQNVLSLFRFDQAQTIRPKVVIPKRLPEPAPPAHKDLVHQIKYKGETLALISHWYTGSVHNWKQIMEYNGMTSTTNLRLGEEIKIPGDMVVNPEPMPASVIKRTKPPAKRAAPKESVPEPEPEKKEQPPAQGTSPILLTPAGPK